MQTPTVCRRRRIASLRNAGTSVCVCVYMCVWGGGKFATVAKVESVCNPSRAGDCCSFAAEVGLIAAIVMLEVCPRQ